MRRLLSSLVLCIAAFALVNWSAASVEAHEPYPRYRYYGNGGHDFRPHWHDTYTPFGTFSWYGTGAHDYRPHGHVRTPWSYESYSRTPWGVTRSYHPTSPYYYSPW